MERLTAVFPSQRQARCAITELREMGIWDTLLFHIQVQQEKISQQEVRHGTLRGLGWGVLSGLVFGGMAALIPQVGPVLPADLWATFVGAGVGGLLSGGVIGGIAGALTGALVEGTWQQEHRNHQKELEGDRVLIAVEMSSLKEESRVSQVLYKYGGEVYNLQKI
ncbi:hypothetical protein [Deinococcus cellulosilyticus]|uniref:Uncharacterized protein n=1 Tax=Deinococcus cellulosilyticus (strain DSM 18568 / NBRC 106333 / KACC 11606 / 5516J-15) TaxID=1223518 RepID=A0A511MWR6_DEIC1|nr:hypothetical protein [Deinococcus cellulosilyticus]GEM44566.1 hypothetical protein DC3_02010 [Deinococcus cellulosilyticus NBRC 106333 = KACC 11606]